MDKDISCKVSLKRQTIKDVVELTEELDVTFEEALNYCAIINTLLDEVLLIPLEIL